jgi:hypothetical protein
MPRTKHTFDSTRSQILFGSLHLWGFDVRDFQIEEHQGSGAVNVLGLDGGILKVRCHSTGEERFYPTGPGSAWFAAFFLDLGAGHFVRAWREPKNGTRLEKLL